MCSPIALVIGLGVASAGLNYMAASSVNRQNTGAAAAWANNQRQKRAAENVRQDLMREQAEGARQETLQAMDPRNQMAAREAEQGRLSQQLESDAGLPGAGQTLTTGNVVDSDLGKDLRYSSEATKADRAASINSATAESRKRIAALAAVQSYGGSQFGLGNRNERLINKSGGAIDMQNMFRKGSQAAYQTEAAVSPEKYQISPWVGLASGIANTIAGGVGGEFGRTAGYGAAQNYAASMPATPTWQRPANWTI